MRFVTWTDTHGYRRRALVCDTDPDDAAPEIGVPAGIPDLDTLDWDAIKRDLHNHLTDQGLITWKDVQDSTNGITSAVLAVMRKRLILLYKTQE